MAQGRTIVSSTDGVRVHCHRAAAHADMLCQSVVSCIHCHSKYERASKAAVRALGISKKAVHGRAGRLT